MPQLLCKEIPLFLRLLTEFEPMHQIVLRVWSLLYLDDHADSVMAQVLLMTALSMAIRLLLGDIVTRIYDCGSYHRIPRSCLGNHRRMGPSTTLIPSKAT